MDWGASLGVMSVDLGPKRCELSSLVREEPKRPFSVARAARAKPSFPRRYTIPPASVVSSTSFNTAAFMEGNRWSQRIVGKIRKTEGSSPAGGRGLKFARDLRVLPQSEHR